LNKFKFEPLSNLNKKSQTGGSEAHEQKGIRIRKELTASIERLNGPAHPESVSGVAS
jgi:hypothetical protein